MQLQWCWFILLKCLLNTDNVPSGVINVPNNLSLTFNCMTCIINQERRQPQESNTLMVDMLFQGSCIINTGSESWMKICEIALMVLEDVGRKGSLCLYIIQGKPWAGCRRMYCYQSCVLLVDYTKLNWTLSTFSQRNL